MLKLLGYAALLAVAGAMVYDLSNDPRDPVTLGNAQRIAREQLNEADVYALLGPPSTVDASLPDLTAATWYNSHDASAAIVAIFRTGYGTFSSTSTVGQLPKLSKRMPRMRDQLERTPHSEAYRQRIVGRAQASERKVALGLPVQSTSLDEVFSTGPY